MAKNYQKEYEELMQQEIKNKLEFEKRYMKMSLEEKVARASREYNDKTKNLSRFYISKSEKYRLKHPSKKQKRKRREKLIRLGLINEYDDDDMGTQLEE
jgi:hypothetical protein